MTFPTVSTTKNPWDLIIPFEGLWEQYERIIKKNGAIVLFGQGLFTAQLMLSNKKLWRYNLIWEKTDFANCLIINNACANFYEDILFTSKEFATKNPKLVKDFYNATMKGWKYAFKNVDEVAKLIYEKYNPQNKRLKSLIFEANEMKKLSWNN